MIWTETPKEFILDTGKELSQENFKRGWRYQIRELDHGVEALFIAKGNERALGRIYFKRTAKVGYPWSGVIFKSRDDCLKWLQTFYGKVIAKLDDKNGISRYEATTLLNLRGYEDVVETYKLYGKDKTYLERLQFLSQRPENSKKRSGNQN